METPTTPPPPRRLVRKKDGAAHVGVSAMTLTRRIQDGTITGYKSPRGAVFVDLDELDRVYFRPVDALADYVRKIVDAAPELTSQTKDRLASLLRASAHPELTPHAADAAATTAARPSPRPEETRTASHVAT